MGVNVQNKFLTKFLVEYSVRNQEQMVKQSKILENFGQEAGELGIMLSRSTASFKAMGIQGKQLQEVIGYLSKNYDKLGLSIQKVKAGKNGFKLKFLDKETGGQVVKYSTVIAKTMKAMTKQFEPVKAGTEGWGKAQKTLSFKLKEFGRNSMDASLTSKHFMSNMTDAGFAVNSFGEFINTSTGKIAKLDNVSKIAAKYSFKQFRAGLLGIMFMAQRLGDSMSNLITGVLQQVGLLDAFKAVMVGILMPVLAPLIEKYLPAIMKFLEDDAHREFIGNLILMGAATGKLLGFFTSLALILGSFGVKAAVIKEVCFSIGVLLLLVINLFDLFQSIEKSNFLKGLIAATGVLGAVLAYALGGIPAIIATVVAVLAVLANKFAIVRSIVMWLLTPFERIYEITKALLSIPSKGVTVAVNDAVKNARHYDSTASANWNAGGNAPVPLASGGIVTSPTLALVGESGPEAVVPLGGSQNTMNYSPTLNVTGSGYSTAEADKFARIINERLLFDSRRYGGGI